MVEDFLYCRALPQYVYAGVGHIADTATRYVKYLIRLCVIYLPSVVGPYVPDAGRAIYRALYGCFADAVSAEHGIGPVRFVYRVVIASKHIAVLHTAAVACP